MTTTHNPPHLPPHYPSHHLPHPVHQPRRVRPPEPRAAALPDEPGREPDPPRALRLPHHSRPGRHPQHQGRTPALVQITGPLSEDTPRGQRRRRSPHPTHNSQDPKKTPHKETSNQAGKTRRTRPRGEPPPATNHDPPAPRHPQQPRIQQGRSPSPLNLVSDLNHTHHAQGAHYHPHPRDHPKHLTPILESPPPTTGPTRNPDTPHPRSHPPTATPTPLRQPANKRQPPVTPSQPPDTHHNQNPRGTTSRPPPPCSSCRRQQPA